MSIPQEVSKRAHLPTLDKHYFFGLTFLVVKSQGTESMPKLFRLAVFVGLGIVWPVVEFELSNAVSGFRIDYTDFYFHNFPLCGLRGLVMQAQKEREGRFKLTCVSILFPPGVALKQIVCGACGRLQEPVKGLGMHFLGSSRYRFLLFLFFLFFSM
jgi:hypothetical protein